MRGVEKKYLSCNNLMAVNNTQNSLKNNQNTSVKNTPTMKRALSIRRPKSLQRLHEDLKPLLDGASSLSSIGSFNELTEESLIESSYSDDSRTHEVNSVVLRPGGKLRSLKHRPRSSALTDRNLISIPENILANNLRKRHAMYIKSLNNLHQTETTGLENLTLMDIDIGENTDFCSQSLDRKRQNRINNPNNNKNSTDEANNNMSSKSISLQNIAIPRRRSKPKVISEGVSAASVSEQSFSKEQKRRLKKKMKDTQKSPQNSVFLGLI
ncbi:protein aardvark-like isoform X5 [Hydractinia symbiolongicarpus]|nr:protein aardvark-like isoform X5 [Hydractinia symbiolongicarpus]